MTFTSLISAVFYIRASVIAMVVCSVSGCTPMKTLNPEVYRPVDYMEAEREAMVSELNATLDEHLNEIHLALETLELKTASQEGEIKRLTAQYSTLQEQYHTLQSSFQIDGVPEPQKEIALESKAATQKRTTSPLRMVNDHSETDDSSSKETAPPIESKDTQTVSSIASVQPPLSSDEVSPKDVDRIYTKARALLLENSPEKAEPLFKSLYQNHPKHTLAVNALYWAGECRYSLHDYEGAITLFKRLMEEYPKGIKVPDAMLKTAYAYLSLDDPNRAHHYLKSLVKTYPFSPAGEKAAEKLKAYQ